jgi:hypothetical protein
VPTETAHLSCLLRPRLIVTVRVVRAIVLLGSETYIADPSTATPEGIEPDKVVDAPLSPQRPPIEPARLLAPCYRSKKEP